MRRVLSALLFLLALVGRAAADRDPHAWLEAVVEMLFLSSTRDDRVHPGHSRKMVAKLQLQHHDALLYENVEGGHGAAANHREAAFMSALEYTFFWQQLR